MDLVELALKLRPLIEKAAESLEDAEAADARFLFPLWMPGTTYTEGKRVRFNDKLYKVAQAHTSQNIYPPGAGTEALYEVIDVTHAGTLSDPIPYTGNMVLASGMHYSQDGITYLCTRNTDIAVYNPLAALVGLYVVKV